MKYKKIILIILIVIWMITVFIFSNQQSIDSANTSGRFIEIVMKIFNKNISDEQIQALQLPIRKLAHFTIYAIGGLLVALLINQYKISTLRKVIYSQTFMTLYAITDEVHQYFIPGRVGIITDVLIDSAGAFLSILVVMLILKNRHMFKEGHSHV